MHYISALAGTAALAILLAVAWSVVSGMANRTSRGITHGLAKAGQKIMPFGAKSDRRRK